MGQDLVRRLAARSDILVENFRPGTMERWGLGWNSVSALNQRLIMVRISGFGQDGPYATRAGDAAIGEAMGGLRALTGYPDRPPTRVGVSIGDSLTGTFGVLGALAALEARHRTGRGQVVHASIYESVLAVTEALVTDWHAEGLPASADWLDVARHRAEQRLPHQRRPGPDRGQPGFDLRAAGQPVMGQPDLAFWPMTASPATRPGPGTWPRSTPSSPPGR